MLENGLTLSTYNFITIVIATGVCALVAFLYYRFCYDSFKKLLHRQKLARMVLENKWYEADTVQDSVFFTDLQSRSREKIVWFPKIYYQMEKGLLHIRCEITLGKYQDQLLRLEDKLESGLYCELTDKTLHDGYIEYTLLYDMIANRITIDEVRAENGCLRLMKNLVWEYDALPHALIAGGTGGGKTYFLLTLIEANGYKTRADASTRMSADQISDVALSIEYVKQYTDSHSGISKNHAYLLRQLVVWQRLSVHLGWQCDNVRASYDEIPKATQDEVFSGARTFVKENKGRYECGGYIYSGEGQELGQFWAKLNVGNAKLQKTSSNASITDGNGNYSIAGATYGVFADKDCTKQLATITTDENGNTDVVEVKAGTVYIKELSAPAGYKVDKTVYPLTIKAGETAILKVSDTPKVTDTLIELFKIDMETQKDNPQGNASLAGAEFTWKYYAGFYNKENLPAEATRTWVTKTIAETDSDGTTHYITKLADAYKVSGDSFYMQDGEAVLPLGTLTVEETKAPNGYLLEGAYMQAGDKSEQIKGLYVTQITEDGDLAVLSGSNKFSVSDKVIRGGVKIQKRDLETGDTKPQGSATLKDTAFDIISLNDNAVLVEGKLYKKNEVVKTIRTDIEGIASTSSDLLPYGKFRIVESEAPDGYLTDGAKPIDFTITENGKIVDLTDKAHSIYNQIKRGDIEGVKIGAGTHKRLADVPFRITSKTTGENHVVVTDDNGQFSTSAEWASHKHNTNAGKTSEDGVWFGTSEPDDSKGALPYDTYIIEELRSESNKGFELIPPFEIVVSRNNLVIDLGTLTDEYEKEISIHTTATSKDGEKTILAGKEVTIVDTVKLDGLTKGTKYQLKGWQMLKEENAELIIDGKRVENDYTFVADDEEMKVEISYTFNASALGGKNLVTFEELYDFSNPDEPVKVAEHKDIEDDGQTVLITERIIKIHTTATDKDGNKELEAGKDVTIIDTVTLEGLEVGTQYKLVGWQMLKEENAELLINGKRVESDYTFTADSETMKVEVAFTFDATSLDGKQLVTFEELYDLSNPDEPKKVTEHKDIEDKGQTITFKEKPEEPEKPETPPTPEKPNRPSDSPKTGDSTNVMAFIVMLLASVGGLAGTYLYKRRKMKKS
ncbi:cell surface protein [Clostridioides difficile]|nr:cell surface protein [Clostridioides difficile]